MALRVPIRFRGDKSQTGLEAERIFDINNWYSLHARAENALQIVIARALDTFALNVTEWLVLNKISSDETENYTNKLVAEDFDLNVPQATVLIKGLIKKNYIRQKISSKDRRVKYLYGTRSGKKVVYDGDQAVQRAMRYWLFDLSEEELVRYIDTMKRITKFEIPGPTV